MRLSYNLRKTKAVLVGISNYEHNFTPIKPALNNVESLKRILLDKDIFGLPEKNIITLKDVNNGEIIDTIENIVENDDLDTFIFYYVGHGYRPRKGKLYLTGTDSIEGVYKIKRSGIEYDDLKELIEKAGKKRIVIIDACYSGIAAQGNSIALEETEKEIMGTYVFTSAPKDEQSLFDTNGKYTFFTKELIETLKTGSKHINDFFSLNDIYGIVEEKLRYGKKPEPQKKDNLNIKNEEFRFAKNKLFNKETLISKAQRYYKYKDYLKVIETIDIIKERYIEKSLDNIYDASKNEIQYSSKYDNCLLEYKEHNFELASKIASEAIIIKEDIRNLELRKIINESKRSISIKNKLSNQFKDELTALKAELLIRDKQLISATKTEKKLKNERRIEESKVLKLNSTLSKIAEENNVLKSKLKALEKENKALIADQNSFDNAEKAKIEEQVLEYEILIEELSKQSPDVIKIKSQYDNLLKQIEVKKKELSKLNSKFYFSSVSTGSNKSKTSRSSRKKT